MDQILNSFLMLPYTFRSELVRDEGREPYWFAWVEEIDGFMATGKTELQAMNRLRKVHKEGLRTMLKKGKNPPVPKKHDLLGDFVIEVEEWEMKIYSDSSITSSASRSNTRKLRGSKSKEVGVVKLDQNEAVRYGGPTETLQVA